ncbi:hypothetical protein INT47_004401 [Mucor saturninus]|uniref:Uncharacterized protein n=1 Tax=Mucor saturninus TaxID=64648 RepID=A0A8H7QZU9_9FUNG|nr:hypothetical protein INT47_004401 [Mucor saturninus]
MGTRVDMLVTVNNLEFLCEEDKASDDNTKMIEERHFKIGKEMKDILWGLFRRCKYDRSKMRKLVSFGITTRLFGVLHVVYGVRKPTLTCLGGFCKCFYFK